MNAENFADILKNASQLYQISYQELKSLVLQYPYCRNLHHLLLKKSHINQRADFERILEKTATHSIDRRYLYLQMRDLEPLEESFSESFELGEDYLELHDLNKLEEEREPIPLHILRDEDEIAQTTSNGQRPEDSPPVFPDLPASSEAPHAAPTPEEESFIPPLDLTETTPEEVAASSENEASSEQPFRPGRDLILDAAGVLKATDTLKFTGEQIPASRPPGTGKAFTPGPTLLYDLAALREAVDQLDLSTPARKAAPVELSGRPQPKPKSSFKSWVKQFQPAHVQPHIDELMENVKPAPRKRKKKSRIVSFAEQSLRENEELVSETLAELLVQQERYEKAVRMYRRLILIFPEKSSYFAKIIEDLQKRQ